MIKWYCGICMCVYCFRVLYTSTSTDAFVKLRLDRFDRYFCFMLGLSQDDVVSSFCMVCFLETPVHVESLQILFCWCRDFWDCHPRTWVYQKQSNSHIKAYIQYKHIHAYAYAYIYIYTCVWYVQKLSDESHNYTPSKAIIHQHEAHVDARNTPDPAGMALSRVAWCWISVSQLPTVQGSKHHNFSKGFHNEWGHFIYPNEDFVVKHHTKFVLRFHEYWPSKWGGLTMKNAGIKGR